MKDNSKRKIFKDIIQKEKFSKDISKNGEIFKDIFKKGKISDVVIHAQIPNLGHESEHFS